MPLPDRPRIYLNEHLSQRLAEQLRGYGFDVVSSHEAMMLSASDAEQLEYACEGWRAVVTFNISDFVRLHEEYLSANREHYGIILSTEAPIHVLIHRLLRLLNSLSQEELRNQLIWLNQFA
ncbi:MAG TPA: DUF5615 family PIN-like protein [Chloroflexia bacterium]|nr:DUF5615 family PIN-like protein [Chloroflexia bacterium]